MKLALLLPVLPGFLMLGCAGTRQTQVTTRIDREDVPPGHCRIFAEVIKIDTTLRSGRTGGPCSEAPCLAWIVVKNVIAHGSGTDQIGSGGTLDTQFAYTLSPTTNDKFPALNKQLPGLSVGSGFIADIQSLPQKLHSMREIASHRRGRKQQQNSPRRRDDRRHVALHRQRRNLGELGFRFVLLHGAWPVDYAQGFNNPI